MSILLVDGDNLLTIGFYGVKNYFYKGDHIGGLYHFINTLRKSFEFYKLDKIVVFWDGEEGSSTRRKIYSRYKENRRQRIRTENEQQSYGKQRRRVQQYLEELYVRQGEFEFCETDDCIAFYTQNSEEEIIVYSSDGDLAQLASEHVKIYNPSHRKLYGFNDIIEYDKEELHIQNVKIAKILCGDRSDSIAGIRNLGMKKLITLFPEIKTQPVTLSEIIERSNQLFNENKNNTTINNILTGVTKYGVYGDEFFQLNETIVSLDQPFLTKEAEDTILSLITEDLDPEGRSYKNTMKMMMEDGMFTVLPKSDDAWINFLNPFLRLTRKEKNKRVIKFKNNEFE
jgi:5'-3' exonuclease